MTSSSHRKADRSGRDAWIARCLVVSSLSVVVLLAPGCGGNEPPPPAKTVPFLWPLLPQDRVLTSGFGAPRGGGGGGARRHKGLDMAAPKGSPVHATAAGVVRFSGRAGNYGRMIVIDHGGGYETAYAHLSRSRVNEGTGVRPGQVIGAVGDTGNATAPHLHYEVRRYGEAVDPIHYLP